MGTYHRWRWGPLLQSCVDGEAKPSKVARVARHAADCPDCTADMELFRRIKETLARSGPPGTVDPALARLRSYGSRITQ